MQLTVHHNFKSSLRTSAGTAAGKTPGLSPCCCHFQRSLLLQPIIAWSVEIPLVVFHQLRRVYSKQPAFQRIFSAIFYLLIVFQWANWCAYKITLMNTYDNISLHKLIVLHLLIRLKAQRFRKYSNFN